MGMMARTVAVTRVWGSANGALALSRRRNALAASKAPV
jgi:hypothetical protein